MPSGNSLETNIDILRSMLNFAYEQGYHELGYDPLNELIEQLRPDALRRELVHYVRHHAKCATCHDSMYIAKPQCNCGLDAILDKLSR